MCHRLTVFFLAAFVVLQTACGNLPVSSGVSSGSSFAASAETPVPDASSVSSSVLPAPSNSSSASSGSAPASSLPPAETAASLEEYFPFQENVYKKFAGIGNEYAEFETFVDYIDGHVMQVRIVNPGTTTVSVYRLENGAVAQVYFVGERYFRLNETSARTGEDFLIKEPLEQGNSWKTQDGSTRGITDINAAVSVPAGDYRALEITTTNPNGTQKDYYAPGVGLVKREYVSKETPGEKIQSVLEYVERDKALILPTRFFYPDFLNDRMVYADKNVALFTGEDWESALEDGLKNAPEGSQLQAVFSLNTKILGIYYDDDAVVVTVDLSSEFLSEMNAGSSFEAMLINCLVNTMGSAFNTQKVAVTIEGGPYSSGHMYLEKGDTWTVNTDGIGAYTH